MIRRKFFLFVFLSLVSVVITACESHMRPSDKKIQELIKETAERNNRDIISGKPDLVVESVTIIAIGKPSKYGNTYTWPIRARVKWYRESERRRLETMWHPPGSARTERSSDIGIREYTLYENDFGEWKVEPQGLFLW